MHYTLTLNIESDVELSINDFGNSIANCPRKILNVGFSCDDHSPTLNPVDKSQHSRPKVYFTAAGREIRGQKLALVELLAKEHKLVTRQICEALNITSRRFHTIASQLRYLGVVVRENGYYSLRDHILNPRAHTPLWGTFENKTIAQLSGNAKKIMDYFLLHPDENLHNLEVAEATGVKATSATSIITYLRAGGFITHVEIGNSRLADCHKAIK